MTGFVSPYVTEKVLNSQIQKSIDKTGEWPDYVHLTFTVPTETAVDFFLKTRSKKLKFTDSNLKVTKHDIISRLMFFYANSRRVIDFTKDLWNQVIPGRVRQSVPKGKKGRPTREETESIRNTG